MIVEDQLIEINKKMVKVSDMSHGSNKRVRVICDYCGKEYTMVYQKYYKRVINGTVHKCACRECEHFKIAESNLINYGTDSTNRLESVKQKKIDTYYRVYGARNPMMTNDIKEKCQNSFLDHYGSFDAPEVIAKRKETMMERYGVDHPSKSAEILAKKCRNNLQKYGVENTLSLDSVREKIAQTTYVNGTGKGGNEQKHICELFGGKYNYPVGKYSVDMLLDDNVIVEYDGSGHKLNVVYGLKDEEEFEKKEKEREDYILSNGYKIIRFIHTRHTKIKDVEYQTALKLCKNSLKDKDVAKYNFDTHEMM